ncbi:hypothetical protein HLPCO_002615 [Haloplasma contractile SSD-17B]|uniref:Uncharacterized protein n=1 Tax=Haloplasma contractile SSD-17B TaxID=1033810 RepID=U2E7Y9_9MOLU|nr:hypothetical protein HLPCO_002615 [Haloplasma contractile SSD-17B]
MRIFRRYHELIKSLKEYKLNSVINTQTIESLYYDLEVIDKNMKI